MTQDDDKKREIKWNFLGDLLIASLFWLLVGLAAGYLLEIAGFVPKPISDNYVNIISLSAAILYLVEKYPLSRRDFGFSLTNMPKILFWGIICAFIISAGNFINISTPIDFVSTESYIRLGDTRFNMANFIFFSAVVVPVVEEIFFRGLLYRVIRDKFGVIGAAAITCLIFALGHSDANYLFSSFVLIAGYQFTNCLATSIVAHILWNSIYYLRLYINL